MENNLTPLILEASPKWKDYQLLDSGEGKTLERFGPYTLIRPEPQAIWKRSLPLSAWQKAHARMQEEQKEYGRSRNYAGCWCKAQDFC